MANYAVFASGRGSNFIAIHDYLARVHPRHQFLALVSDQPDSGAVAWAREHGLRVILLHYPKGKPRGEVEAELLTTLGEDKPDLLVFAGFMRLVSPVLIDAFPRRIVNIHPALLPRHPGAHAIAESYASGDTELGITIHYVDYGMDTGEVIVQESFSRNGDESLETIEARIHALEHGRYPRTVALLLDGIDAREEQK